VWKKRTFAKEAFNLLRASICDSLEQGSKTPPAANDSASSLISDDGRASKNDHIHLLIPSQQLISATARAPPFSIEFVHLYPLALWGRANLWIAQGRRENGG
jgi:hypothetical protein